MKCHPHQLANAEVRLTFEVAHMLPLISLHAVAENVIAVVVRVLQDGIQCGEFP